MTKAKDQNRTQPSILLPLVVACALFMENLDSTVLATALPAIAESLNQSPLRLNLAITSYLLSLAVFIPISGWVADRFGARTVFRWAIIVFVGGSVLCGFSTSLEGFVVARVLQGMGGAMMTPVGRLIMLRSVPKAGLVRAMSFVTIPALVGPIVGPPLGGFIVTYADWRWIFWINVPIGIIGVILVSLVVKNVREAEVPPLDLSGFALSALALTGLVFGFETVGRDVVPTYISLALLTAGAGAAVLYVRHARRHSHPVLKLALLRHRTFRASMTGGFLFRIGVGATPFLLPLLFQVGFGLNPLQSGLLTFAAAIGAMTMKIAAAPILRRFGFRKLLVINAVVSSAFMAASALFEPDTPEAVMLAVLLLGGFFRSLQFTCVNIIAFAEIPKEDMSRATSFSSMAQQLSLSVGVGMGAIVLHAAILWQGTEHLAPEDFRPAFLAVAAIAALSSLVYRKLPADAGAELSGHRALPGVGPGKI